MISSQNYLMIQFYNLGRFKKKGRKIGYCKSIKKIVILYKLTLLDIRLPGLHNTMSL